MYGVVSHGGGSSRRTLPPCPPGQRRLHGECVKKKTQPKPLQPVQGFERVMTAAERRTLDESLLFVERRTEQQKERAANAARWIMDYPLIKDGARPIQNYRISKVKARPVPRTPSYKLTTPRMEAPRIPTWTRRYGARRGFDMGGDKFGMKR